MKKIFFSFLLLGACLSAKAQQDNQVGYYYGDEKVYYPISYDRIIVGTAPRASFKTLQQAVAAALSISADSVIESYPGKQLLIKLGRSQAKADGTLRIDAVKQVDKVLYARPVFVSESGAYNSYGTDFIVKLKATTTFAQVQQLMAVNSCTLVRKYPFQDDLYIVAAGKDAGYNALSMANLFYETGLFDYAEPDKVVYDAQHVAPNDPLFSLQWGHANAGTHAHYSGVPGADMKVQQAWDITMGQPYIKVGVIDEGVDLTHPDLQANLLQGFNGATLTSNPGDGAPLGAARAHGTNCAGVIAAVANNNTGVAGVAPACKIIPATIFGPTGTYLGDAAVAAAFDYCRMQGASVIANSWGGGAVSSTIDAAINRAVTLGRGGKGCLVLFSTGNGNGAVSYPATNASVVSVGGVNMCNERKSTSSCDGETWWGANYGTGLDVVAPCVKIATTDIQGTGGYNTAAGTAGNYNASFNGTSSACPSAAGVAALIFSVDSSLTLAQARQILESSCDKVPGYTYATNAAQPAGTWNNSVGYGRVNARSAVQLAATGQFCTVQIQAASMTYCNGTVGLTVLNPDAAATYVWRRDSVVVGNGTTYSAPSVGVYEAVITKGTCSSVSTPITLQPSFSLQATATPSTVCTGGSTMLVANADVNTAPYCAAGYSGGTGSGDYISLVSIAATMLNNASTGATANPYHTVFPQSGSTTATLTANTAAPYTLTLKGGTWGQCYIRGWIDYNRDGVFSAAESIGVSPNVGALAQGNIVFTVPASAFNGVTRLRLRSDDASPGPMPNAACTTMDYGETEDYLITIAGGSTPAFTYTWACPSANSILTSTSAAQITAQAISANTTYTLTATNSAGCVAAASVDVEASNTWTGAVNTAWDVADNWSCNAVPGTGANVVIPITANQPHLTSSSTAIGKLALTGVLHLNDKSLTLAGPVIGTGTFSGSAASNLVITGPAGELRFTPGAGLLYGFMLQSGASASIDGDVQLGP